MTTTTTSPAHPRTHRPPSEPTRDPVLDQLLDEELAWDPLARGGFINHLSMSLVAARRLGAGDDVLRSWFDAQTSSDFLLPRDRPDWLDPTIDEVARRGLDEATAALLPSVARAPGSQFFHAPIRLELALDARHPGQVANALHNWSDHSTAIEPGPEPQGDHTYAEVVAALLEAHGGLRAHASDPTFRATFDQLDVTETLLDDVAATVAAIHAAQDDFLSLHLVTGTRTARALAPLADADTRRDLAVRTAHSVALTWLGGANPALADADTLSSARDTVADWGRIGRAAIDTGDPHVVKLVYACRLEEQATGDPLYRWLAARQARIG